MHSIYRSNDQVNKTFIEQARQAQLVEATIEVLARRGYINTSFAQIGKHANISPSLISYHFKDKDTLMRETLKVLLKERALYIDESIAGNHSVTEKLQMAIVADMQHMTKNHGRFHALMEIIFGFRTTEGTMSYMGDTESPMGKRLRELLEQGKKTGEFGDIDPYNITVLIEGAENSFLAQYGMRENFDIENFTKTLLDAVMALVKKG